MSASALGRSVSLGILSTGTAGYVTLQGTSYQMPQATFQKLESSFAQLTSTGRELGLGTSSLSKLGIQPLHWLTNPTVVGTENVGGTQTTHIHAGVNVNALLSDLNTVLEKASSLGVSGASSLKSGIPAADRSKIASEVKNPSVDIWTGTSDKTIRRLTITLTLPVTGKASSELGGMTSADLGLTMQYSDLNQPQTIKAPTTREPVHPVPEQAERVRPGAPGRGRRRARHRQQQQQRRLELESAGPAPGPASSVAQYSQCIQEAGTDVAKMQKCASLLSSGSGG